ncbi:MAG: ribosome maturation factor RimP [Candidatus Krumholzibacteriota bacterium]|nr:ribosome maturation factor RimP [Candidatus Krumholzibacteriota bacterium]
MADKEHLVALLNREIDALGFELVKLDRFSRGRREILRIFIDDAENGVTIDDCVKVTKALGLVLDGDELLPGSYNLEVSTPGMNRPLTKREHFVRFTGKSARVEYLGGQGEKSSLIGEIEGLEDDCLLLSKAGISEKIEFDRIVKANLHGEKWGTSAEKKNLKSRGRK